MLPTDRLRVIQRSQVKKLPTLHHHHRRHHYRSRSRTRRTDRKTLLPIDGSLVLPGMCAPLRFERQQFG